MVPIPRIYQKKAKRTKNPSILTPGRGECWRMLRSGYQVPVQVSSSEMAVIMGSTLLLFPSVPSFTVG